MQQLNSKNYQQVDVLIRGDEKPIALNVSSGTKLMDYLTSGNSGTHVQLTTLDGTLLVVRTTDILRVMPSLKVKSMEDYA